jgi:NAD-dependent SIR2 family protein deacetylase
LEFHNLARAQCGQCGKQLRSERQQIANMVAFCPKHGNSEEPRPQILLKLQILVHRYQEIEAASHRAQQFAIGKGSPSMLHNARNIVPCEGGA